MTTMRVFVNHNSADKEAARLIAMALAEQGITPWFDAWDLRAGESLTGRIAAGIESADVFVLVWSERAANSRWVDTELRAFLRRSIDDPTLRVVPVMLDETPLPVLVADFKGFSLTDGKSPAEIAFEISGSSVDVEIAARLQARLIELTRRNTDPNDPLPILICPSCASDALERSSAQDLDRDHIYYLVECADCGWGDWSE